MVSSCKSIKSRKESEVMEQLEKQILDISQNVLELTVQAVRLVQNKDIDKLNELLVNRDRAINILNALHENLQLYPNKERVNIVNSKLSQIVSRINQYDEIITECLEHQKKLNQTELATTHRGKQGLQGYNLNNLKG